MIARLRLGCSGVALDGASLFLADRSLYQESPVEWPGPAARTVRARYGGEAVYACEATLLRQLQAEGRSGRTHPVVVPRDALRFLRRSRKFRWLRLRRARFLLCGAPARIAGRMRRLVLIGLMTALAIVAVLVRRESHEPAVVSSMPGESVQTRRLSASAETDLVEPVMSTLAAALSLIPADAAVEQISVSRDSFMINATSKRPAALIGAFQEHAVISYSVARRSGGWSQIELRGSQVAARPRPPEEESRPVPTLVREVGVLEAPESFGVSRDWVRRSAAGVLEGRYRGSHGAVKRWLGTLMRSARAGTIRAIAILATGAELVVSLSADPESSGGTEQAPTHRLTEGWAWRWTTDSVDQDETRTEATEAVPTVQQETGAPPRLIGTVRRDGTDAHVVLLASGIVRVIETKEVVEGWELGMDEQLVWVQTR